MARDANLISANASPITLYRQECRNVNGSKTSSRPSPSPGMSQPTSATRKIPCSDCGNHFPPFSVGARGIVNTRPHKWCSDCYKSRQRHRKALDMPAVAGITEYGSVEAGIVSQISAISTVSQNVPSVKAYLKLIGTPYFYFRRMEACQIFGSPHI